MQGIIIRLPKTWLNKVHKQKSASLFLLLIFIFIFLLSFCIWRKFADNCNRICFYYFYFYFDFVLCFRLFCALFSSRFALNCCCNAAVCARGSRQGEGGEGRSRGRHVGLISIYNQVTKYHNSMFKVFITLWTPAPHTDKHTNTKTHTHTLIKQQQTRADARSATAERADTLR